MKNKVILGTILLSLLWSLGRIRADDCQVPIFSQQKSADPNVLFILDCSGSMNCVIQATQEAGYLPNTSPSFQFSYDASTSYSGSPSSSGLYTGYYGSGWYRLGTTNRPSIDNNGVVASRGSGSVWVYLNYNNYCEMWSSHWGGTNSAERRSNKKIYYYGTRYYDYVGSGYNYLRWLLNYARIRHITNSGTIYDLRGSSYSGRHYVVDLPRVNATFNNDPTPGNPPLNLSNYNPTSYPPNKRMIPVFLDDLSDSNGTRFLDPLKLTYSPYLPPSTSVYDYWRAQPACRANLAKFAMCMSLQPEIFGGESYPIDMRFGLMTFAGDNGGKIVQQIKDMDAPGHISTLDREAREMPANTNTPLAETLYHAGEYFRGRLIPPVSPIESKCQMNFVVYLTDGEPCMDEGAPSGCPHLNTTVGNYDQDNINETTSDKRSGHYPPGVCNLKQLNQHTLDGASDYLDDVAQYLYDQDLDSGWWPASKRFDGKQNLITYTIGLYIDYCMLKEAAEQSTGKYYPAKDSEKLKKAFTEIVGDIVKRAQAGGAVAPALGLQTQEEDRLGKAYFHPDGWKGYLDFFTVEGTVIDTTNPFWQGHYKLSDWELDPPAGQGEEVGENNSASKARQIFTTLNGTTKIDFDVDDAAALGLDADVIRYIRGYEISNFRSREAPDERTPLDLEDTVTWRLGHIVHSTPILVGPPKGPQLEKSYLKFRQEYGLGGNRERKIMVYVGANDGMLHAFKLGEDDHDNDRGKEMWGYIPGNLLSKLPDLTERGFNSCPKYYVDLTPTVTDIVDPSDYTKYLFSKLRGRWEYGNDKNLYPDWRTYLIGGERAGGKNYFCLDITDVGAKGATPGYTDFDLKWDRTYTNLGQTWSDPQIKPLLWDWDNGGGSDTAPKWVAIFGSGYDNGASDSQAYLFIVNVVSGDLLTAGGPIKIEDNDPNVKGKTPLGSVAAYDVNWDGVIDKIYFGDIKGNLWKVQVDTPTMNVAGGVIDAKTYWKVDCLFRTKANQPITAPPLLTYTSNYDLMVLFGTGRYHTEADISDLSVQTFYAIIDEDQSPEIDYNVKEVMIGELADQTDPDKIKSMVGKKGWYIDLDGYDSDWDVGEAHLDGERVINRAAVEGRILVFTSFAPVSDLCEAGGKGYMYALHYLTGTPPGLYAQEVLAGNLGSADSETIFYSGDYYDFVKNKVRPVMDIKRNGVWDGVIDEDDLVSGHAPRSQGLGDGIPSRPVVDFKNETINVQTSDAEIIRVKYDPIVELIEIRSWKKMR